MLDTQWQEIMREHMFATLKKTLHSLTPEGRNQDMEDVITILRNRRLREFTKCKRQHRKITESLKNLRKPKTSAWSTSGSSERGGKTT